MAAVMMPSIDRQRQSKSNSIASATSERSLNAQLSALQKNYESSIQYLEQRRQQNIEYINARTAECRDELEQDYRQQREDILAALFSLRSSKSDTTKPPNQTHKKRVSVTTQQGTHGENTNIQWPCSKCTFLNSDTTRSNCEMCETPRDHNAKQPRRTPTNRKQVASKAIHGIKTKHVHSKRKRAEYSTSPSPGISNNADGDHIQSPPMKRGKLNKTNADSPSDNDSEFSLDSDSNNNERHQSQTATVLDMDCDVFSSSSSESLPLRSYSQSNNTCNNNNKNSNRNEKPTKKRQSGLKSRGVSNRNDRGQKCKSDKRGASKPLTTYYQNKQNAVVRARQRLERLQRNQRQQIVVPLPLSTQCTEYSPNTVFVTDFGAIPQDAAKADKYCDSGYIYPIGFKAYRVHLSYKNPRLKTKYFMQILDGGMSGPLFQVYAEDDCQHKLQHTKATTPWQTVIDRISEMAKKLNCEGQRESNGTSGIRYFGLRDYLVAGIVELLPNAEKCKTYWSAKNKYQIPPKPLFPHLTTQQIVFQTR